MSIFSPAPHIERLPEAQIDSTYKRLRREVFAGTFIGYATFYLIRQNFSLAVPYMIAEYGYTKADLGIVMTILSVAYGVSKFVMGNASDRSNPKYFSTVGLLLSALVMLLFGTLPGVMSSIPIMCVLALLNGWFQGMGYPPYAKNMVTWFSRSERGAWWSWWNVSHNLGGGIVSWAPTYLTAVKGFTKEGSRWAYFLYEWAGIPGMLVSGYLSDRVFRGRRAPATICFMLFVILAILVYWFNPAGNVLIDNLALIAIGFLIYGPVMMIGLQAADMVPRVATGGATGLTGLLGYLIGSAGAGAFMGLMVDLYGWDGGFIALVGACILSIVFLIRYVLYNT
ncbi:MAG: MFS transporter [Veillonella sp.]|nr:MFS transporter [Veillonella sp.]